MCRTGTTISLLWIHLLLSLYSNFDKHFSRRVSSFCSDISQIYQVITNIQKIRRGKQNIIHKSGKQNMRKREQNCEG
jgi:hypothetical protein